MLDTKNAGFTPSAGLIRLAEATLTAIDYDDLQRSRVREARRAVLAAGTYTINARLAELRGTPEAAGVRITDPRIYFLMGDAQLGRFEEAVAAHLGLQVGDDPADRSRVMRRAAEAAFMESCAKELALPGLDGLADAPRELRQKGLDLMLGLLSEHVDMRRALQRVGAPPETLPPAATTA